MTTNSVSGFEELPEMCVVVLQPDNVLIGIKRSQRGYFQMYDGEVKGEAALIVADRINSALHVSPRQREAMLVGSMMGWECPGADPASDLHQSAKPYCTSVRAPTGVVDPDRPNVPTGG